VPGTIVDIVPIAWMIVVVGSGDSGGGNGSGGGDSCLQWRATVTATATAAEATMVAAVTLISDAAVMLMAAQSAADGG
jgi:hypothetical protein